MRRLLDQVAAFHRAFGHPIAAAPTVQARKALRVELIREEFKEFQDAVAVNDIVGIADALGDLAYVIAGAALEFGIPLEEVIEEIHRANMSKLGADGKPITRADGKSLKGPNYTPPDIAGVLSR
jgi:predicted HAD superfamily Cof-like phosphohydrolase